MSYYLVRSRRFSNNAFLFFVEDGYMSHEVNYFWVLARITYEEFQLFKELGMREV